MENKTPIALHIAGLIHKVREKETLSESEWNDLQHWRRENPGNELIFQQLQDREYLETEVKALLEIDYTANANAIYKQLGITSDGKIRKIPGYKWLSAAAILLFLCIGAYLWLQQTTTKTTPPPIPIATKFDVPAGKQGAILTLADGSSVVLDSLGNGLVATQAGSKILLHDGQLAYEKDITGGALVYNTMSTPKGRQFRLVLPDGTKVWLNAASSLRYPTTFTDKERRVEVTGEAYFEVAQEVKKPFIVEVDHTTAVEVLGTHFNINAYKDEASVNTTLLEGAVRVVRAGESTILKPGQQAQSATTATTATTGTTGTTAATAATATTATTTAGAAATTGIKIVRNPDVEKIMAWKNGVFDFQDASLEDVMRQLQRWYDIEVVYEKGVPKIEFIGKMGRDLSLSAVLSGLQLSKVHFRLEEGRRLVVLP